MEEQRIYVVIAKTLQVNRVMTTLGDFSSTTVAQPIGRQVAQACHVVSKLRKEQDSNQDFVPVTTVILQCRDSAELYHVMKLLIKSGLCPVNFQDINESAYGPGSFVTCLAVFATKQQIEDILDYLPLLSGDK